MADRIKFILDGCDISFVAEAPEDMTLKQLLEQADKIFPDWCACGICSMERLQAKYGGGACDKTEIVFDYDSIKKTDDSVSCQIHEDWRAYFAK